jgi:hypothetical protein
MLNAPAQLSEEESQRGFAPVRLCGHGSSAVRGKQRSVVGRREHGRFLGNQRARNLLAGKSHSNVSVFQRRSTRRWGCEPMLGFAPFSETSSSTNISTMHGAVPQLQDYLEHSPTDYETRSLSSTRTSA